MESQNNSLSFGSRGLARQNSSKVIIGAMMVTLILVAFFLRRTGYISPEAIFDFLEKHRTIAPVLFIILYSIMPSLFLPTLPLMIGSGFLWGPFWGLVFSIVGSTSGASLAFLISRYIGKDYFANRLDFPAWGWITKQVDKYGWQTVAFTRINPIFPATILNYLFGVTSIPFLEYLWATFVFMLPPSIAFVAFGSSIREFVLLGNIKGITIGILIAASAIFILFALNRLLKKVLPENE
jgi:uncharacterized membrane protein YdjX (TVP38/TMEM64 family)